MGSKSKTHYPDQLHIHNELDWVVPTNERVRIINRLVWVESADLRIDLHPWTPSGYGLCISFEVKFSFSKEKNLF
jgi:hypothetical protein